MSATARTHDVPNVRLHTDKWWARHFQSCSTTELHTRLAWQQARLDHPHPRATERARLINEDAVRHIAAEIEERGVTAAFAAARLRRAHREGDLMDRLRTSDRVFPQRSLLALTPGTRGAGRIYRADRTMQGTYELNRMQIHAVK